MSDLNYYMFIYSICLVAVYLIYMVIFAIKNKIKNKKEGYKNGKRI